MEVTAGLTVRPVKNVSVLLDYYLATGRYTQLGGAGEYKMNNINELNLTGTYTFNDTFGVYAKLNNILCQKYEVYYGYLCKALGCDDWREYQFLTPEIRRMGDINIKQLESLRWRMRVIETLTVIGTAWIALAVYQKKEELVYYLVGAVVLLFLLKYYTQFRLRKRQFVSNLVEQRTMELRFQRDAMQAESEKLSRALSALADAQDELVRKERLASIGQLTKGLVDRILNPLNYINNFAHLSVILAKDIKQNIDEDEETGKHDNYNDTQELLVLLTGNLDKIAKHGDNTVRIVKAMEELLKDHSANRTCVDINDLCKVNLDILRKNYAKEIEKNQVDLSFSGLSVPLTIEVNIDQMGKALSQILDNSIYAVLKKLGEPGYQPSVSLVLRIQADKLQVVIRDNGVGIEETIKTKVFSPFFTTKPTAEAAGTGLYLSREVVLNHKGTIAIESEKDKYTEVTITLPIYS